LPNVRDYLFFYSFSFNNKIKVSFQICLIIISQVKSYPMYNVIDLDSYKKDCSIQYAYRQGPCFDDCMCETNKGLRCEDYSRLCLCVNKDMYWSHNEQMCIYFNVFDRPQERSYFSCHNNPTLYFNHKSQSNSHFDFDYFGLICY